ncbi:MAG TPA: cytochrome P450 [Acidimicrobiales bacterium]|nr:cytochrome P450 [Acidimicrobiales bacterium]
MPAVVDPTADGLLLQLFVSPEARRDPYPVYRQLRHTAPVLRTGFGPIVLSGYDDCMTALRDPRLGRGTALMAEGGGILGVLRGVGNVDRETRDSFLTRGNNMLFADPPDHTRLRRLVSRAFTPSRTEALRPGVQRLASHYVDAMLDAGDVEVMEALALQVPVTVIGDLLGVPVADRAGFQTMIRSAVIGAMGSNDDAAARAAMNAMEQTRRYFEDLVAQRRAEPGDDLLSGMIAAREAGDALSDDEVIATAVLLFIAGFETTTNLIGNGLLALLQHPAQMDAWRADPSLAPRAVDELLRWDSPVQLNIRVALQDADVAGEPLPTATPVIILQGAANRDPAHFKDAETFDVSRADNVPLSFGWGIHHCIGASLARMEGEVIFNELLGRTRAIQARFDVPDWRTSLALRGLSSLPVSLTAA